jgi:hypothetical protein
MIDEERSHVKLGDEKGEETTSEDGMRRLRFHLSSSDPRRESQPQAI